MDTRKFFSGASDPVGVSAALIRPFTPGQSERFISACLSLAIHKPKVKWTHATHQYTSIWSTTERIDAEWKLRRWLKGTQKEGSSRIHRNFLSVGDSTRETFRTRAFPIAHSTMKPNRSKRQTRTKRDSFADSIKKTVDYSRLPGLSTRYKAIKLRDTTPLMLFHR